MAEVIVNINNIVKIQMRLSIPLLSFLVAKENEITRKVFTEVGCESVDQDMDTSISSISSCSSKHFNRFYMEGVVFT